MPKPTRALIWHAAHSIAGLFMAAYMTARVRALDHLSGTVRLIAHRDHCFNDAALLEKELAIHRSVRSRKPPRHRPHYAPGERSQILQLMQLRGWSAKQTAQRFLLHPNTIRNWISTLEDKHRAEKLLGEPPWNKIHEAVRWLVREMRILCPEREFGTRTIARHIVRSGIQISRSSVRRILDEQTIDRRRRAARGRKRFAPDHIQHPNRPMQVWHLDITSISIVNVRLEIAAIIDGFSRRLVALKLFDRRPTTNDLINLFNNARIGSSGSPRFLITDHGSQFRTRFHHRIEATGTTHVRCSIRTWQLNAKVERVFRDIKAWAQRAMLIPHPTSIQLRLDAYLLWHNSFRPHAAHETLTPFEAERGLRPRDPIPYRQRGGPEPIISVYRRHVRGDPRLFYPEIEVTPRFRWAA